MQASFNNIKGVDILGNSPIRILSFDIECISKEGFPKAQNIEDKVITIGVTTQSEPSGQQQHVVLQLNDAAPLQTAHWQCFFDEK